MGSFLSKDNDNKPYISDGRFEDDYESIEFIMNKECYIFMRYDFFWDIFQLKFTEIPIQIRKSRDGISIEFNIRSFHFGDPLQYDVSMQRIHEESPQISYGLYFVAVGDFPPKYVLKKIGKQIITKLLETINLAPKYLKYTNEKRDLGSLALSSKDFIDIEPKPRRSPLQLWGKVEERTETAKDEALNIFARHYYPGVMKNMGKEIGKPIKVDINKNREKSEIHKMNILFNDELRKIDRIDK